MVNDNVKRVSLILLTLAVMLMAISFVLISNTIRLLIYSKRFLIHTMKLVGGYTWFYQKAVCAVQCGQWYFCVHFRNINVDGSVVLFTKRIIWFRPVVGY